MLDNEMDDNFRFVFGGDNNKDYGIPPLSYGYSYLLLLKEDVGIVDIYNWLAEILFFSFAQVNEKEETKDSLKRPVNIISFFIDDHSRNLAFSALGDQYAGGDPMEECLELERSEASPKPHNFVVNTFANFGEAKLDPRKTPQNIRSYNLVGAGNPMQMMRAFSKICDTPYKENGKDKSPIGDLNCIVINSISNLCRSMGLRDAMAMVRSMLERAVWKTNEGQNEEDTKKRKSRLLDNDGLLFAVLHENIFSNEEIQYAKTFFDGIIEFKGIVDRDTDKIQHTNSEKPTKSNYERQIGYSVIGLPGLSNTEHDVKFGKLHKFVPRIGVRLELINKDEEKSSKTTGGNQ